MIRCIYGDNTNWMRSPKQTFHTQCQELHFGLKSGEHILVHIIRLYHLATWQQIIVQIINILPDRVGHLLIYIFNLLFYRSNLVRAYLFLKYDAYLNFMPIYGALCQSFTNMIIKAAKCGPKWYFKQFDAEILELQCVNGDRKLENVVRQLVYWS